MWWGEQRARGVGGIVSEPPSNKGPDDHTPMVAILVAGTVA